MPTRPPTTNRGFLNQKTGPLPNWAWGGIILLGALAFNSYKSKKSARNDPTAPNATGEISGPLGNQTAPYVFIRDYGPVNVPVNVTVPQAPPGGGRDQPPIQSPPAVPIQTEFVPPNATPTPTPTPTPKPAERQYTAVRVARFTDVNPPWNSTLWGIAEHYGFGGQNWGTIWNDVKNSNERIKTNLNPRMIQPGDTIYVPNR